jgi:hypothetical protein
MRFRTPILLAACTLVALPLGAQQRFPIRTGVLAGTASSSITDLEIGGLGVGGPDIRSTSRRGSQFGVMAMLPVRGPFSLQGEVHYIQKGGGVDIRLGGLAPDEIPGLPGEGPENFSLGFRTTYIEAPLLARLEFGTTGWRPFVVAGPALAFRSSCKLITGVGTLRLAADCNQRGLLAGDPDALPEDDEDPIRRTDVSGLIGGGLTGTFRGRMLSAQVRYARSLQSVFREELPGISPRNRTISLLVGLGF